MKQEVTGKTLLEEQLKPLKFSLSTICVTVDFQPGFTNIRHM